MICRICNDDKEVRFFGKYKHKHKLADGNIIIYEGLRHICRECEYKIRNKLKVNSVNKSNKSKYRLCLTDSYVKSMLIKRSYLNYNDIPCELINIQKQLLILKRNIKNYGKQ